MTTDDGEEIAFEERRRAERPVRVIPIAAHWRAVLAVATALGISFGGMTVWIARAFVRDEIVVHDRDTRSHYALLQRIDAQSQAEEGRRAEIGRLTTQIEQLQRDIRETRELVVELRTILRRQGGRER